MLEIANVLSEKEYIDKYKNIIQNINNEYSLRIKESMLKLDEFTKCFDKFKTINNNYIDKI
jgi:cell fate (sporulation/competence/biofilm development) regulator YmcA (YheA/YmcA/DUF963 family)